MNKCKSERTKIASFLRQSLKGNLACTFNCLGESNIPQWYKPLLPKWQGRKNLSEVILMYYNFNTYDEGSMDKLASRINELIKDKFNTNYIVVAVSCVQDFKRTKVPIDLIMSKLKEQSELEYP